MLVVSLPLYDNFVTTVNAIVNCERGTQVPIGTMRPVRDPNE